MSLSRFSPGEIVHCRFTGQAFVVDACDGVLATLHWAGDPEGETSTRIVGDLTRPPRRVLLIAGECVYCDANRGHELMPPHDASPRCESDKHNHCTCDTCF